MDMHYVDYINILPIQNLGKEIIIEKKIEFSPHASAKKVYELVKDRLLHVNDWYKIGGFSRFQIINANGVSVNRRIINGDYLRIDVPGPGSKIGRGYDWVRVEELIEINEEDINSIGFRVRPAHYPFGEKNNIAHFFSSKTTSCFIITRNEKSILITIIDRNIIPNSDIISWTDKLRHRFITLVYVFSKLQWRKLANGLIADKL
ncbi:hypothetical protein [Ferruginibacter albus]|uniref:hypothetical protein n=1 Tax=Ferruginibacter albus TaxID=2875540 RepID=UPI001CC636CE|nr:hypothetical protein [Ferruginibacter albus]UAY53083.1 hypothetical protein K9M53_05240 [Ferruginibacter albus]